MNHLQKTSNIKECNRIKNQHWTTWEKPRPGQHQKLWLAHQHERIPNATKNKTKAIHKQTIQMTKPYFLKWNAACRQHQWFKCSQPMYQHVYELWWKIREGRAQGRRPGGPKGMSFTLVREHRLWASETSIWPRLTASNAVNYHILHLSKSILQQISGSASSVVMGF